MSDSQRVIQWLLSGDTGVSSKTIVAAMTGVPMDRPDVPYDPADFGRCYRLLQQLPEWRPLLSMVAQAYPEWTALVREWDALTALYETEKPTGTCLQLYRRMKLLIDEGRRIAGWEQLGGDSWRRPATPGRRAQREIPLGPGVKAVFTER